MAKDKKTYYKGNQRLLNSGVKQTYDAHKLSELIKCSTDIPYFLKTYVKIISVEHGTIPFNVYQYQENMIDLIEKNNRIINLAPRQSGKTEGIAGFLLHYAIFNENKEIAVLAHKEKGAKNVLNRIKKMYMTLPHWLQVGVSEWNKNSIVLGNGSKIYASATSANAIRGDSVAIVYIDETAFIPKNIWDDFYASAYPTVASSPSAKIILSSTPFGMNHFYKLWSDAEGKKSSFVPYRVFWNDVPGRDAKYKQKTIDDVGIIKWDQEYDCQFLGSAGTLISGYHLQNMVHEEPKEYRYDNKFRIYRYPEKNRKYLLICDVAEGVEGDASTIQIVDVSTMPYEQVAVFECNQIKTDVFPHSIKIVAEYYNDAVVIVEQNSIGDGVLNNLNDDVECDNIFYHDKGLGLKMTRGSKKVGNAFLKSNIEDGYLILHDFRTIQQFSTYIKKGDSYSAADEEDHDDLVTPFIHFSYFMRNRIWVDDWLSGDVTDESKKIKKLEDDLLPIGFMFNGEDCISLGDED